MPRSLYRSFTSRWLRPSRFRLPGLLLLVAWLATPSASALVISELMYHSNEPDQRSYEFIELYNESIDPLDLSGFWICNGVDFVFPPDTWLDGKSFLVVCTDESVIQSKYGLSDAIALGNWLGALSNGGERIEICNPGGRTVVEVDYNDGGKWPMGADGTGHTLSLISPFLEVDDPDSWALSEELGGTPGAPNTPEFASGGTPTTPSSGLDASGFILRWLVLGPYEGGGCLIGDASLEADWLRESAGGVVQTDLEWLDGQTVNTNYSVAASTGLHPSAGGATPTVREVGTFGDTVDFQTIWPGDPDNVMAYAFVYVDNVTDDPILVDVACASDDAIVVMLNGSVVHTNDVCRAPGASGEIQDRAPATLAVGKNLITVKVFEQGGGWAFRMRLEERGTGTGMTSKSQIQITTDPEEGLFFGGGGTPIEPPDGGEEPPPDPGQLTLSPVVINEADLSVADPWIELYNRTGGTIDLGGYHLTNDAANLTLSVLPAGTELPAGGYLVLSASVLGLDLSPVPEADGTGFSNRFIALVNSDGDRVLDAGNFKPDHEGKTEARVPDGDSEFEDAAEPTPGSANRIDVNQDVVINEILYHSIDDAVEREFIELHNRSDEPVNLTGWRVSSGFNFDFAPGTSIPGGGYLVVCRDPALIRSIYGLGASEVVGPEDAAALAEFGVLRDRGERVTLKDELGRTVDTVRYHDGGEWARWADGHGSSLELIDAWADNRIGQAWDASDDSQEAEVATFSYLGQHGGGESELHLLLTARGITLVDDVSIIGGGVETNDTPLIENDEVWRYFKGTEEPPSNWMDPGFNDGSWLAGQTGIGYGDGDDVTELTDMGGNYLTVFCRKTFSVTDPAAIDELVLSVVVDDGFYAYLNGTEVASHKVAGKAYDAPASSAGEPELIERDLSSFKNLLQSGSNVLAVQVHNAGLTSSDLSFIPRLLDRTTVVTGGSEQVMNGHFDSNTAGWLIDGTHVRSARTTDNPIRGAGSLKIVATGRGDNKVNRIETPEPNGTGLNTLTTGEDLAISFKARWVVGAPTMVTHGYRHFMARTHSLAVPDTLGTPGRINSVTERLIAETGDSNLGPVITDVVQEPVVPADGEDVTVTARVLDPDGVDSVVLRYSLTNPSVSMTPVTMTHSGGDYYRGVIPGRALGTIVLFYITATDTTAQSGRYPLDVLNRTHPLVLNPDSPSVRDHRYAMYRHATPETGGLYHRYRFVMSAADESYLGSTTRLSNETVEGSFIFGDHTMYYGSQLRFSGSPFTRGPWNNYRVALPRDNMLHEVIRKFNLDRHSNDARERISHYLIRNNQGMIGVPYSDAQRMVHWSVNGGHVNSRIEHTWAPDAQFVSLWYPSEDDGNLFEVDDRFVISDSGGRDGSTNATLLYPPSSTASDGDGENKENYRWFFGHRTNNGLDDYSELISLAKLMDPGQTPNSQFAQQIFGRIHVEEFLRLWAVRWNTDDWDQWGSRRGKNCYLYRRPESDLWELLPWDLELTYGSTTSFNIPADPSSDFNPGTFAEVNRLMEIPAIKRMYYGILKEMVAGPNRWFHSDHLSTYASKLAAIGMSNTGIAQPGGFIDQRADIVAPRIQSVIYPQVRVRITTNGGSDFSTSSVTESLSGTAPAEVGYILVSNNGDEGSFYSTRFPSMTTWAVDDIFIVPGTENNLTLYGIDLEGRIVESDTIRITSTSPPWSPPSVTSIQPEQALPGEEIEILGSGFHNGVRVFFGDTRAESVQYDESGSRPDRILAVVPPGTGTVLVRVENLDGQSSTGVDFTYSEPLPTFLRGDANTDSSVDLSDGVRILLFLFQGEGVECEDAADVDDDEQVNITDAIYLLDFLFRGGPPIPPPYPARGTDPAGDALGCGE